MRVSISAIILKLSSSYRLKRGKLFLQLMNPKAQDRVIDLGSGTGYYFSHLVHPNKNVYIADINYELLELGKEDFGFQAIQFDANKKLPFKDKYFDIIFCNSLIEHTTGDSTKIFKFMTNKSFENYAFKFQKKFANEIRRVGKSYFIQTPNKYFPIESHTWLPFIIIFLPRRLRLEIIRLTNRFWIKKTYPNWNLLTVNDIKQLFPDAEIILEKFLWFTKSIIAVKKK